MKKLLAWGLSLVMTIQLLPLTVWAAELENTVETQAISANDLAGTAYSLDDTDTQMDGTTAANLNSIVQQMSTSGITAYSDTGLSTSEKVLDLTAWDDGYLTATVVGTTTYLDIGTVTVPAGESSSFQWDIIGEHPFSAISLGATDVQYVNSGNTLSLTNSTSEDKTYTITLAYSIASTMSDFEAYTGTILNAIQFSNPVNLMFYQQGAFRDNGTVFLGYDKSNAFYGYSDGWMTSYTGYGSSEPDGSASWDDVISWNLFSTLNLAENTYNQFTNTANAIFGDGTQSYSIRTDWTMSGFTTTTEEDISSVWMEEASIWPYDADGDKMGVISYYSTSNYNASTRYRVNPDAPFSQMSEDGEVYSALPIYFYLNKTYGNTTYQNTLEMVVTGDGMPTKFYLEGSPNYKAVVGTETLSGGQVTTASYFSMYTDDSSIAIYDVTAPTVTNVYANDGFTLDGDLVSYTYSTGQYVPITLEFSEPVVGSQLSVTINDVTYTAAELHMSATSATQTAWYQVQDVDSTFIVVSKVSNIVDLMSNTTDSDNNSGNNWSCTNITMESTLMRNSVEGILVDTDAKTVALTLNQDTAYQTKYADYHQANNTAPFMAQVVAPDGTDYGDAVQFYFTEDELTKELIPSATLPVLPIEDDAKTYTVEVYAYETTADTEGFHLWWYDSTYGSEAKIQLESVEIVYPENDTQTLSLSETYRPTLSVNYTPSDLTSTGGTWSSSDTEIATIDENGNVVLEGKKVGTVNFTFTADNGTTDTSDDKTATTYDYTVLAGDKVSLVIPDTFQNIVVRQGNGTTVFWSSNANLMPGYGTVQYQVAVYEGNFDTAAALSSETAVYTSELFTDTTNSYVIPAGILMELGTYTICVTIPATDTTVELNALAWVTVNAQMAGVSLTAPDSLYLLDSKTADIGWNITNFGTTTDATLTVTQVTDTGSTTFATEKLTAATGIYTFDPSAVTALKETYMFSVSATNNTNDVADMDGFILYVYNGNALEIEIDRTTLNNTSAVNGTLPTDTAAILALREELALIEYIGINYDDYSWSMLKDGIAWDSSSDDVSINYKQGSLYENLSNFSMETYLPQTQMLLSSVTDGTATITATHANTGMSDSVTVEVDTLRNEFYLFQISPMVTTALTYTDGLGNVKTVNTNSEGYLALYEPEGINSDVTLRAESGSTVYLGTIYQADLTSGERDSTLLQLYPLNSTTMRQVAQLDLYLTNPDGSPFVGSLTLRGGVYVDDVCRSQAQMQGNGNTNLQSGDTDQIIQITDGYLTVNYNSVQFVDAGETLTAKNDIQYILELSDIKDSNDKEYYPQLVYSNATLSLDDIMYSADSIITLEDATGNENTPFISNQYFLYDGLSRELDIQTFTGRIGPNKNYQSATVYTNMLLWGEDTDTDFTLYSVDENGYQPEDTMNTSENFTYDFSSIPLVRNTLTLTEETMTTSDWVAEMTDRGVKMRLENEGSLVQEKTMPWRVLDMTNVDDVLESSSTSTMVSEMLSGSTLGTADTGSNGNAIISGLLTVVTPLIGDIEGSPFNIIITPTEHNAVFDCLIWGGYDGMGLDEVDYSNTGLALESDVMNASISMTGVSDLMGMAGGDDDDGGEIPYDTDPEPSSSTGSWGASFDGQLQGYYQGEITYNFTTGQWEMHVLEGGFTAGFQGEVSFSVDTSASGIPLFVEVEMGGAVQLDFNMATRYQQIGTNVWADTVDTETVNDYLTTLRLLASAGVFGGVGFDYSVISFKIGPYGEAAIDSSNLFLTRDYLADESQRSTNGQYLEIEGEIGAKMEATFLLFSTEVIFGSGSASYAWDWNASDLSDYWADAATYGTGNGGTGGYSLQYNSANTAVTALSNTTTLQSRDYLSEASTWAMPIMTRSLDTSNGLSALQSNANPNSYPVVSDDGHHLLYVSDTGSESIYDSRVYATVNSFGSYAEGTAIASPTDFDGYGDSGLSLSGDSNFAAAAWVRLSSNIEGKDAGDAVTIDEQVLLMNSSEIVVSLWDGSAWASHRLTTNGTPDLAPMVATNDDGDAIVAWRSVYSGTGDDLMNFEAQDYIMYSVYDSDAGTWSEASLLYNGSAGTVMGLDAEMLSDGTAMVSYSLDKDTANGLTTDYEIAYSIVDSNGDHAFSTVVTSDNYLDENPQIVVADLGDDTTPDERFVLGWYNNRNNVGDIRLLAVDSAGIVSNAFPESLAHITATTNTTISGDFQFAHMDSTHNDIKNLTILWEDIIVTATGEADYSVIRAVSFTEDEGNIGLTAVANLAQLPSSTLLDHFDAYVSNTNEVKAVIQSTYYNTANTTEMSYIDGNGLTSTVDIPSETTMLYTATQLFENRVEVQAAIPDYQNLALNSYNAIQFSVFNGGLEDMTKVEISIDGQPFTFENLDLAPNDSKILTCWYKIGGTVEDTDYTLTATFDSDTKTATGDIYLDYPDIGISQMTTVSEVDGIRTIRMSLYNASIATLSGNKNRSVELAFYDGADSDSANDQTITYTGTDSNITVSNGVLTITGEENLERIDNGVFMVELTYDVGSYVEDTLDETEIPDSGVRLYANGSILEGDKVLPELNSTDNTASVSFDSLLTRVGETVTLDVAQSTTEVSETTVSTATITLKNNSLQTQTAGGAMIVSLLDENGNALEQKQVYIGEGTMTGEAVLSKTVTFAEVGTSVSVVYGELETGSNTLMALNLGGQNITASDFVNNWVNYYTYVLPSVDSGDYAISIIPTDTDATVTLTVNDADCALTANATTINLPNGRVDIVITINNTVEYNITIYTNAVPIDITFEAGTNGSVSPSSISVDQGTKWGNIMSQVTATPATGYVLDGWYVDGVKIDNVNQTFEEATTITAKFVEKSTDVPLYISSNVSLMPSYLTLTPDDGNMTYLSETSWGVADGQDATFTLDVAQGEQYYVNNVQYRVSSTTYTVAPNADGTFTIPWNHVKEAITIWANTTAYYTATFKADGNSTMADVTYYASGLNLYETLEDLKNDENAITSLPLPVANADYRLAADTADEPRWTDADDNDYTTADILEFYWQANKTFTVNTMSSGSEQWTIAFVAGDHGTVSSGASGTYTDGTIITVPTPVPDTGYQFSHWTDSFNATVTLDSTIMAIAHNTYTANFKLGTWYIDYNFSGDWLYYVTDTDGNLPEPYSATYGEDLQFKLVANQGYTIPDLVYTVDDGSEMELVPDSNGVYTIPGNAILGAIQISEALPKTAQTLTFTDSALVKTQGDIAFTNALSGAYTAVTYTSSNDDVATVNASSGLVNLVGVGTATITATAAADSTYQRTTQSYGLTVNDGEISLATDQTVVFDATYADLTAVILTVDGTATTLTQTGAKLSGYAGYTFNNGIVGEVIEGSVEVTLYKEFLATLPAGNYSVGITTNSGEGDGAITATIPAKTTHTVTIVNSGDGTSGEQTLDYGTILDLTSGTLSGYTFSSWTATGGSTVVGNQCMVLGDSTITANWSLSSSGGSSGGISYYSSTLAATTHGTVTLSGTRNTSGATVTITPTPDNGYEVDTVVVAYTSGKAVSVTDNGDGTYSYKQPGATVTVTVTFAKIQQVSFTDVDEDAYYYDAVLWAVANGITSGTTETTFSPNSTCTRAQAVVFLYRTAGEPEVSGDMMFTDVDTDAYYYDAVLWAVQNGITAGASETTFSPDAVCSRSQIVTFMYRAAGEPEVTGTSDFTDVSADMYYYDAVLWAVSEGITSGTTDTTFSPNSDCARGQIVTFLYRNVTE